MHRVPSSNVFILGVSSATQRRCDGYTAVQRCGKLRKLWKFIRKVGENFRRSLEILTSPRIASAVFFSFFFLFTHIQLICQQIAWFNCLFFNSSDYVNNFWTSKTYGLISSWIGNRSKQDLPGKYVHKLLWIGMGSYVQFPCYRDMFKYSFLTITFSNDLSWKFHKNPTNVFPFCLFKGWNVIKCCYGIAFDVKHYRKMKINRFFLFLQSAV